MDEAKRDEDGLTALRAQFPQATFLALGQTALWDEPSKAALVRRLQREWPDAGFVAGVHDTDYFAKLPGHPASAGAAPFALLPHDDWTTRGLWSAAGEMHQLFGSEDLPTRAALMARGGVSLPKTLAFAADPDQLLADLTVAFGWRGLVRTGWKREVVADVRLSRVLPALLAQIDWATQGSVACLDHAPNTVGQTLRGWVEGFAAAHPDATLPELYTDLLPRLHGLLLGEVPAISTTRTTELLRFNTETAGLPRFAFVDRFLNPATRPDAEAAYNLAVAGSDIYTLDQFGDGALPFEIAVPGKGRGTLHVLADSVRIDTPQTIVLEGAVASVGELAALLEAGVGADCTLLGKAVSLLPMLAAEFVFVFHEGASSYSDRTRLVLEKMAERGVALPTLHPILRVRYRTWDALAAAPGIALTVPAHLRQALGRERILSEDLADCWRRALGWERARLAELARLRSPRALLEHFARTLGGPWRDAAGAHDAATHTLLAEREKGAMLQSRIDALETQARAWRAEIDAAQKARGDDFRRRGGLLDSAALAERAAAFDVPMAQRRAQVRVALAERKALTAELRALEHGPATVAAREALHRAEADAERERARQAGNALRTIDGLPHANLRPTAWWFPLVDPSGAWFDRVADTAEFYLEPLAPLRPSPPAPSSAAEEGLT